MQVKVDSKRNSLSAINFATEEASHGASINRIYGLAMHEGKLFSTLNDVMSTPLARRMYDRSLSAGDHVDDNSTMDGHQDQ